MRSPGIVFRMRTAPVLVRLLAATALVAGGLAIPAAPASASAYSGPSVTSDDIGTQVVGGRPATENYSFLVYSSGCTASLIKANWVVTAKHCPTPSSVRVGSVNRTSGGVVVGVLRAVNHPSIDVKLMQLRSSVSYAPAPIPSSGHPVGTPTRIIGWGLTCPYRGCGSTPTVAHELDTSVVSDSRCYRINGPYEICTNNPDGDSGACYGDSGGPQVRKFSGSSRWWLIGATSRSGNGSSICATGPSIYGDLVSIRSWINSQVGGLPA